MQYSLTPHSYHDWHIPSIFIKVMFFLFPMCKLQTVCKSIIIRFILFISSHVFYGHGCARKQLCQKIVSVSLGCTIQLNCHKHTSHVTYTNTTRRCNFVSRWINSHSMPPCMRLSQTSSMWNVVPATSILRWQHCAESQMRWRCWRDAGRPWPLWIGTRPEDSQRAARNIDPALVWRWVTFCDAVSTMFQRPMFTGRLSSSKAAAVSWHLNIIVYSGSERAADKCRTRSGEPMLV